MNQVWIHSVHYRMWLLKCFCKSHTEKKQISGVQVSYLTYYFAECYLSTMKKIRKQRVKQSKMHLTSLSLPGIPLPQKLKTSSKNYWKRIGKRGHHWRMLCSTSGSLNTRRSTKREQVPTWMQMDLTTNSKHSQSLIQTQRKLPRTLKNSRSSNESFVSFNLQK